MQQSIRKRDFFWSYAGYIAEIAIYVVLTPVLAVMLDSFVLGLWYTFMGIYAFINIFDGGFSPIITRNASYCMSGAKALIKEGLPEINNDRQPNYQLLYSLYKTNRRLMGFIMLATLLLLFTAGTAYITYILKDGFRPEYIYAWFIFSVGLALNLYTVSLPAFLKGIGAIAEAQKCILLGRTLQMIVCVGSIFLGFGIQGLACGILIGALIILLSTSYYINKLCKPHFSNIRQFDFKQTLHAIWHNSFKLLLVALGAYGITQMNTMLCSSFLGLTVTAQYGLTLQAFQAVGILSFVWMQTSIPAISVAKATSDIASQRHLLGRSAIIYYLLFALGSCLVIFAANPVLKSINAQTILLGKPFIILVMINALLEKHISLYSNFIMCGNNIPYVKASLLSGAAVVGLALLFLNFTSLGLIGLLLSQLIVQACYNDWKWTHITCKDLNMNFFSLLGTGFASFIRR